MDENLVLLVGNTHSVQLGICTVRVSSSFWTAARGVPILPVAIGSLPPYHALTSALKLSRMPPALSTE